MSLSSESFPAVQFNADLSAANTLALHSTAGRLRVLRNPAQIEALLAAEREVAATELPQVRILGGGSNVILAETVGCEVWQVATRGIWLEAEDAEGWQVRAAAGEVWHDFVQHCLQQGWQGLENLALIPGTVGAAPVQNIGAYGLEVAEYIIGVRAYDRFEQRWRELSAADCQFAYRDSVFKRAEPGRWLIAEVFFRLPRQWQPRLAYPDLQRWSQWPETGPTPMAVFEAVCQIRQAKLPDPRVLPNAGSFFKNPVVARELVELWRLRGWEVPAWPLDDGINAKVAAAWLIEQAGWKGRRLGPVGMHDRHALVLVNHGGASSHHVLALAAAVRAAVRERFGVELEIEPVAIS